MIGGEQRGLKRICAGLFVALVAETAWLAYPAARDLVAPPRRSLAARGRDVARDLGCFSCHGPRGRGGVPNPGSQGDVVPSLNEGTPMMFVHDDQDIREYILEGAPARKRARESYRKRIESQAIRMPAYRGWVDDADVDALVAFVRASSELLHPEDGPAARGAEVARANGCFSCHGEMGSGGLPNPGSLKGYIPGFGGADFEELVQSDEELHGWIRDGTIPRLRDDPLARYFLERQRIRMPAYGRHLEDRDIEALTAYVRWLAGGTWARLPLSE
jgi:mono/diheme cytochrome c family protein